MYVDRNNWSLQLDIEQPYPNENKLRLNGEKDSFNERTICIDWKITESDLDTFREIRQSLLPVMEKNGLRSVSTVSSEISTSKVEDIYHPVGFLRLGTDSKAVLGFDNLVNGTNNLYHFSTGMFPSARSINPTAAGFCFIEKHLQKNLREQIIHQ
jgi:hypothetical protein